MLGASSPRLFLGVALVLFALPAVMDLARTSWQTEAGSLAPIILTLGIFSLWQEMAKARQLATPGSLAIAMPALLMSCLLLFFASAIAMASLSAVAVWSGGVAVLYAAFGRLVLQRCAFPLAFLAMMIPLPYSLSISANAALRNLVADQAVSLATFAGIDAAIEHGTIIVGQYVLAIENACSGANSTLSLVSLSVLYAYWIRNKSVVRAWVAGALAIPIAISANIGRVVALMALVESRGSSVLSTALHPLAGLLSFMFAASILLTIDFFAARFIGPRHT